MKYSLAIFDMDGTILNTLDDMTDSLNVILGQYKLPLHTAEEVRFMVGNGIPKLIERAISGGRDNPDFENILKDFIAYYEKHCAEKTAPYAGIPECIKKLRQAGIKIAVNTNKVEAAAVALCDFQAYLILFLVAARVCLQNQLQTESMRFWKEPEWTERAKVRKLYSSAIQMLICRLE